MKEPRHSIVHTINPATKRKRRKRGTSFSNSKQRKRIEFKKKDLTWIEGKGTMSDLSKTCVVDEIGSWN